MAELGKLIKVDVREVWQHEARDFSSWLAKPENLAQLNEELGIEIEPIGTEADIGRFRIDILGQELSTGAKVIIENQLEPTNHDHLGKVITYAAGLEAKYLIWIVKDVLPEHLKAVEWLNEHLDDDINCFLLRIEVWKIGDSKPAPRFEVVAARNDWASNLKKTVNATELSESKLKQLQFWQSFVAYMKEFDPKFKIQKPGPKNWTDFSMGTTMVHTYVSINSKEQRFSVGLYIPKDREFQEYLKTFEEDIAEALGNEFGFWEARTASGLYLKKFVDDIYDESKQKEYFQWIYETVKLYRKTFEPYIADYLKAETK
jgi:hypothetical protein